MKLLTKEMRENLPTLGSTAEESNPMCIAHFFNPCGAGDWYVIEGGEINGQYIFYGIANIIAPDFGEFTLQQLEEVSKQLIIPIERDLYYTPEPAQEVYKREFAKLGL